MKRRIITILLIVSFLPVFGQITVSFLPGIQGRNIDGLLNCRLINTGNPVSVFVKINVSERAGGKLCEITTAPFILQRGTTAVPPSAVNRSHIRFGNSDPARFTRMNGFFPRGDYEYTFDVISAIEYRSIIEQVFDHELEPLTELLLTEPYHEDEICNKRPVLSWQPSVPAVPGAAYRLVLAQVKSGQTALEALNYNYPVINQAGIRSPVLPYPAVSRQLEQGMKYSWQVTYYKDQTILNRSEVWEFTVNCQDTIVQNEIISDEGYRDIEDLMKGNYYIADGSVRFSLMNSYEAQKLNYSIECISDPKRKVRRLPEIDLKRGRNMVMISLGNNGAFTPGYYYLLKVALPNGSLKQLRFLYK